MRWPWSKKIRRAPASGPSKDSGEVDRGVPDQSSPTRSSLEQLLMQMVDADREIRRAATSAVDTEFPGWQSTEEARRCAPELRKRLEAVEASVQVAALHVLEGLEAHGGPGPWENDTAKYKFIYDQARLARSGSEKYYEQLLSDDHPGATFTICALAAFAKYEALAPKEIFRRGRANPSSLIGALEFRTGQSEPDAGMGSLLAAGLAEFGLEAGALALAERSQGVQLLRDLKAELEFAGEIDWFEGLRESA